MAVESESNDDGSPVDGAASRMHASASFGVLRSKRQRWGTGLTISETILRVTVVDDESVRRGICQLLTANADIDVVCEGADGADAIRKAREHRPDLILMDVTMPTMNGLDATRIIKREMPRIHIVVVSQHDAAPFRKEAMSAGASAYIMKSEIAGRLLAEVRKLQI